MKVTRKMIKLARMNGTYDRLYADVVQTLVRRAYPTPEDEVAILRQMSTKPEEFAQYNEFVEQCKVEAREYLSGIEAGG